MPGQPSDWISRLVNQISVKTGSEPASGISTVQATAPAMPIRVVAPAAQEIRQGPRGELAKRVADRAQRDGPPQPVFHFARIHPAAPRALR